MAILMLFDRNNTHPDPVKDEAGCYKRGDIVAVLDDAEELVLPPAPPFVFLRVTGITKAQAERFMESETAFVTCPECGGSGDNTHPDPTDPDDAPLCRRCDGATTVVEMIRRRKFGIPWNLVPNAAKNALQAKRYYSTSWASIRQYIHNKRTGTGQ